MDCCSFYIEKLKRNCKKKKCNGDSYCSLHSNDNRVKECSICLSNISKKDLFETKPCNHSFHKNCIGKILSENCPYCRTKIENIPSEVIARVTEELNNNQNENFNSFLMYLIESSIRERIIENRLENFVSFCRIEILKAIEILQKYEIPLKYLPNFTFIKKNCQNVQSGFFQKMLIKTTLQNAYLDFYKTTEQECIEQQVPYFV